MSGLKRNRDLGELQKLYLDGNSIHEINKLIRTPLSTIRFRLKNLGILRNRKEAVRWAASKGLLSKNKGKHKKFTTKHIANIKKARIKWGKLYSKGKSLKPSGIIEFTRGENKGRSEHSVIMEKNIGRKLFPYECIHHKNKKPWDNRIENLQLMTKREHASLHAKINNPLRKRDSMGRFTNDKFM